MRNNHPRNHPLSRVRKFFTLHHVTHHVLKARLRGARGDRVVILLFSNGKNNDRGYEL